MAEDQVLRGLVADLKKVVEAQGKDIEALQGIVKDIKVRLQDDVHDLEELLDLAHEQAHEHDPVVDESAAGWQGAVAAHATDPDAHHE